MTDRLPPQSGLLSRLQENSRTWFGWMPPANRHGARQADLDERRQPRFWDVASLEAAIRQNGGPLLLDVASCKVEFVPGSNGDEQGAMWLPVMVFRGRQRRLIIDSSIAQVLSNCTRSRLVLAWGQIGRVALMVRQIDDGKQIMIKPIGTRPLSRYLSASQPL